MRRLVVTALALMGSAVGVVGAITACGSSNPANGFGAGDAGGADGTALPQADAGKRDGSTSGTSTDSGPPVRPGQPVDAGQPSQSQGDGGCQGFQCQINTKCGTDAGTTISGTIYDPAQTNPLFNVLAFVPLFDPTNTAQSTMQAIVGGTANLDAATCASCDLIYSGNPVAVGSSGTDGKFTITNAPDGTNIPVIVQVGKWRTHITVPTVTACQDNAAGSISLPTKGDPTDPVISLPQIAVSTGFADSLECLLLRIGLDPSEYTAGAGGTGHVHLYTGGDPSNKDGLLGPTDPWGLSEPGGGATNVSSSTLWDSVAHLQQYDITLLSCEGGETYKAIPANLDQYVNTGGRVFASHFHYAWFTNPTVSAQSYTPPAEWSNLATWSTSLDPPVDDDVGGSIVTTLNTDGGTFPKGVALQKWLQGVSALGTALPLDPEVGITTAPPANKPSDLAIGEVRFNAKVTSANTVSQAWVTADPTTLLSTDTAAASAASSAPTSYFSFDTPVNAASTDGGAPPYCGRVVFSGLHVGGGGSADTVATSGQAPTGCSPGSGHLSPQEKALEFMLFDLSACVTPDTAPPWTPPPVVEAGVPQ